MQVRKSSLLIRLVAGSGILNWDDMLYSPRKISLCPFFWQVVISLVFLPLRPVMNSESDRIRSLPWWGLLITWVGLHIVYFNLFLYAIDGTYHLPSVDWHYNPQGILEGLLLALFIFEVIIPPGILMIILFVAGLIWLLVTLADYFRSKWPYVPTVVETESQEEERPQTPPRKPWPIFQFLGDILRLFAEFIVAQKRMVCPPIELID